MKILSTWALFAALWVGVGFGPEGVLAVPEQIRSLTGAQLLWPLTLVIKAVVSFPAFLLAHGAPFLLSAILFAGGVWGTYAATDAVMQYRSIQKQQQQTRARCVRRWEELYTPKGD